MPHMQTLPALSPFHNVPTLSQISEHLGPMPRKALGAMVDYGLNDLEIARYFNLDSDTIRGLRHAFGLPPAPED